MCYGRESFLAALGTCSPALLPPLASLLKDLWLVALMVCSVPKLMAGAWLGWVSTEPFLGIPCTDATGCACVLLCRSATAKAVCRNGLELSANLPDWVFALIFVISSNGREQLGSWGAWEVGQTHMRSKASQKLHCVESSAEELEGQLFMGASSAWEKGAGSVWCAGGFGQQMVWQLGMGRRALAVLRGQRKVWVPHLPFFLVSLGFCLHGLVFKAGKTTGLPSLSPVQS